MNAERLSQTVEQFQSLWNLHVPTQYQPPVVPTALGLLILGIGVAVLGARMARGGLTFGFACLGGLTAFAFRSHVNWSPGVLLAVGMAAGALAAFLLFRLWVGVAAAVVFSALAVGVYGSKNIAPHFVEYDSTHNFNGAFVIPEAPPLEVLIESADSGSIIIGSDTPTLSTEPSWEASYDRFRAWAGDFWLYVQSKESDVNKWVMGIAIGAALFGFLVGSVLPRLTLIVGTACLGTMLVLSGMAALARHLNAQLYDAALTNPRAVGIVGLALLATSLILQALLTRRPAADPAGGATQE